MKAKNLQSLSKFKSQLKKVLEKEVQKKAEDFVKEVALKTYQIISSNTSENNYSFGSPVLTGKFMRNHRISIGSPNNSINNRDNKKARAEFYTQAPTPVGKWEAPSAWKSLKTIPSLSGFKLGDNIYITNSLSYARDLEYNKQSPAKSPRGIYRVAAEKIRFIYKDR